MEVITEIEFKNEKGKSVLERFNEDLKFKEGELVNLIINNKNISGNYKIHKKPQSYLDLTEQPPLYIQGYIAIKIKDPE